jgi:hypothetical protein
VLQERPLGRAVNNVKNNPPELLVQGIEMTEETFRVPIVKLGGRVDYDGRQDLWRLEVAAPYDLAAVLVAGSSLRILLETTSEEEKILRVLIEQHRERVELYVATAELSKWPDAMGVFPDWKPGREPS